MDGQVSGYAHGVFHSQVETCIASNNIMLMQAVFYFPNRTHYLTQIYLSNSKRILPLY